MANDNKRQTLSLNTPDVTQPAPAESPAAAVAAVPSGVGVTQGDLDELREQNTALAEQNRQLHADFEQLMAELRTQRSAAPRAPDAHLRDPIRTASEPVEGETPVFLEDEPHGVVTGDSEVGFVQNGHQFSRDKRYLATERHHGTPRPFNPRLVGITRARKPDATLN